MLTLYELFADSLCPLCPCVSIGQINDFLIPLVLKELSAKESKYLVMKFLMIWR